MLHIELRFIKYLFMVIEVNPSSQLMPMTGISGMNSLEDPEACVGELTHLAVGDFLDCMRFIYKPRMC